MAHIFAVYKTDSWHSYNSRDTIGMCTTKEHVMRVIKQQVKKESQKLDEDDIYNLNNISQTQGYSGDGEFHFEMIETNKLL